jgi:hypothetical protein
VKSLYIGYVLKLGKIIWETLGTIVVNIKDNMIFTAKYEILCFHEVKM